MFPWKLNLFLDSPLGDSKTLQVYNYQLKAYGSIMKNISVILNEPRFPENIGAAARCCKNMGIPSLIVVRPELPDRDKMLKMATHEAAELIENMEIHESLEEALAPFSHVAGTTARQGRDRRPTHRPREAATLIRRLAEHNRVALLFGSENKGLSNAHLKFCHSLITIPTTGFSSINLAQSVMIICYEVFAAGDSGETPSPRLANIFETEAMYAHLEEMFHAAGLHSPENPDYWLNRARRFLNRCELRAADVRLIRGLCRQVLNTIERMKSHENIT